MNPFETGQVYAGHRLQTMSADDRIARVNTFSAEQCRAALTVPDLQKTVRTAVERRLRALDKERGRVPPPPAPQYIDVVFDAPPGPVAGRFVEVEDAEGRSISVGEWVCRPDGYWALRIRAIRAAAPAPTYVHLVIDGDPVAFEAGRMPAPPKGGGR